MQGSDVDRRQGWPSQVVLTLRGTTHGRLADGRR